MLHTSANPQQKVELAATFSACPTSTTNPTMVPCLTFPKYSRPSCPVQPKPNLVLFTLTPVKQSPCNTSSKRWATSNLPHPSKPTTAQPMASSPTTFNHATPKRWTCNSTGCGAVTHKANSATTGIQDPTTKPTIGPNIIVRCTMLKNAPQY